MSVMVISDEVFQKVYSTLKIMDSVKVMAFVRPVLRLQLSVEEQLKMADSELKKFVTSLYEENQRTYDSRYNEKADTIKVKLDGSVKDQVSAVQLYQWLRGIQYNTELSSWKGVQLNELLNLVAGKALRETKDFKETKWVY